MLLFNKTLILSQLLCFSMTILWGGVVNSETQLSLEYSIAKGGRLYDKWFKESEKDTPKIANSAYPKTSKYYAKKGSDWRCKECHGWDYLGDKGIYSSGKHYTGIKGVAAAKELSSQKLLAILSDVNHRYNKELATKDIQHLINFIQKGQVDMPSYINRKTKKVNGNIAQGKKYYQTLCANCHALDGKGEQTPPLGLLANNNPWEVLHKILFGQPGEEMPALIALDISVSVDILAYLQSSLARK